MPFAGQGDSNDRKRNYMSSIPGYTASLGIWIVPVIGMSIFFYRKKLLSPEKSWALFIAVSIAALVGIGLDLLFARSFFTFPNHTAVCGFSVNGIPVEEFLFYLFGDWFILFFYVFCDEWLLSRYNIDDTIYVRYRSRLSKLLYFHRKSMMIAFALLIAGFIIKRMMNPAGEPVPGYFYFLVIGAFLPSFLFWRVTRRYVNWRAFLFVMVTTLLVSVIWEVTLALPCGWWGYRHGSMLGIFIEPWSELPIEAVMMWLASGAAILIYEFVKIRFFTPHPSLPAYQFLIRNGYDWREK